MPVDDHRPTPASPKAPGTPKAPDDLIPVRAAGRKPWARSSFDLADDLCVPADLFTEAALLCNCWWVKGPQSEIGRNHADRVITWLHDMGVVAALQSALPPLPAPGEDPEPAPGPGPGNVGASTDAAPRATESGDQPSETSGKSSDESSGGTSGETSGDQPGGTSGDQPDEALAEPLNDTRLADIARVEALVREHSDLLGRHYGRWLIGEVLRLLWDNTPARRVVRERGILLVDIRTGIERVMGPAAALPTGEAFTGTVFNELKRLHRGRLAFLFIDGAHSDTPRLVTGDRPTPTSGSGRRATPSVESGDFEVGQVVWVAVEETDRGMRSRKRHPAVLLARTGRRNDRWVVVTMTSDVPGDPDHRRVPDGERMGLEYGGYVWHTSLKVYKTQIERAVGWIHHELIHVVDRVLDLRQSIIDDLRRAADRHHGPPT